MTDPPDGTDDGSQGDPAVPAPIAPASTGRPLDDLARADQAWAAKADQFTNRAGPPVPTVPMGGGATGGGSAGLTKQPKQFRNRPGPRFSGRTMLGVFGLLGVLLTVAIMVFLAIKVLSATSGNIPPTAAGSVIPSTPLDPGSGGAQVNPDAPVDSATAATCNIDRDTIESAIESYRVLNGGSPPDVATLVDAGFLKQPDEAFAFKITDDQGTLVGTGVCAGT